MTSDKKTIDTHKISVYTASAGSGKTYTLTRAYIRLSVAGDSHWQARQAAAVLAITFTNAAAADMKRKIMETLAQVASGADEAADLQAETGLPAGLLRQRAGDVLRYLLHDYGNFSVQTIDSFVQRVIRPFAFELGLPRTYETDIETDRWVEEIRENLLSAYGMPQQQTLTALLDGFLDEMAENEDKGRMEITPALNRVLGMAFEEKSEERLRLLSACDENSLFEDIAGFAKRRRACEKAALAIYTELTALIRAENLEADDFQGKSRGFWTFFKNPLRDGRAVLRAFVAGEEKATWRKSVEKGFLADASRAGAVAGIRALYDRLQGLDTARYIYEAALEKHLYALALMKRADDLKDRMQQAEGRVPISEFNRKIHGLLAQTDVPYLYERVGAVYRHILVDEFQDTSTLQWENLLPLIDNNRASGDWNMVVGDPKQSIYRFRSANVEQMLALRENTALAQNEKLVSNWRSEPGIIAFNNLFYRFLLEEFEPDKADAVPAWDAVRQRLQRIYTAHEQYYKTETACLPAEDPRAVRVCFYEKAGAGGASALVADGAAGASALVAAPASASADAAVDGLSDAPETYEAWNIRLIQTILRHHEPGEVAVLCTRNDRVNLVASCLVENGVKVDTDSSLLLRTSLTVRLLVAALRYMGAPRSETARRKLQWFMARQAEQAGDVSDGSASVADAAATVPASDGGVVSGGGSASDDETLTRRLRYLRGLARSGRSLYDKLQHILRTWDLRADTDQYVLSFMDLVQRSGLRAEADFVREWEDNWAEKSMLQTAGGQRDAVRVTTVHKSKGLEYPVVIYAFASDAPRNEGWVWTQWNRAEADGEAPSGAVGLPVGLLSVKDALAQTVDEAARTEAETESVKAVIDRINMLYVTTTRPRLKLYVLSKEVARSGVYAENRYWARFTERYPAYLADETEWTEAEPTVRGASAAAPAGTDASLEGQGPGAADAAEVGAPTGGNADAATDAGAADAVAGGQTARRLAAARQADWMPRFEPAFSYQEAAKRPERIWGEFIHSLLSGISDANRFDRAAVAAVVAEQWPEVAPSLTDDGCEAPAVSAVPDAPAVYTPDAAVAQVEAVLAHPLLQACFSPIYRIYNERELCCDGRIYRPDRVAVGPDDLYVVDYKTGEAHAEHVRQVEAYRDLLFRMTSKPVRAYIVYIRPQTVEVKEVMASEESSASAS